MIALGLYSGFKNNFKGPTWFILIVIGSGFLLDEQMPELELYNYVAPIAIIGAGVIILLRPKDGWDRNKCKKTIWDEGLNDKLILVISK